MKASEGVRRSRQMKAIEGIREQGKFVTIGMQIWRVSPRQGNKQVIMQVGIVKSARALRLKH